METTTIWHLLLIVYISQVTTYLLLLMLSCTLMHPYIQNLGICLITFWTTHLSGFLTNFQESPTFKRIFTYLEKIRIIIIILLILFHSSDMRGFCLLKCSSEMLQYLPQTRKFTYHWEFFSSLISCQILYRIPYFAGTFQQAQTSIFWRVICWN